MLIITDFGAVTGSLIIPASFLKEKYQGYSHYLTANFLTAMAFSKANLTSISNENNYLNNPVCSKNPQIIFFHSKDCQYPRS